MAAAGGGAAPSNEGSEAASVYSSYDFDAEGSDNSMEML